ncbi:MAG: T9SS type A sorting domain-containing protein [Fidelibacterota bacterium]
MKRSILLLIFIVSFGYGNLPGVRMGPNAIQSLEYKIWDGNQISTYHRNNGAVVDHNATGDAGLEWPIGSGKTAVFASGLWLAAGRINGVEEIRTAVSEYTREYTPGPYGSNPNAEDVHIYTIHAGDDASNPDWQNWPVDQGAPWADVDGDGVYDPNVDHPDVRGDLFHWYVMNDGGHTPHFLLWNTPPLGVEVRVSLFGEGPDSPLKDVMFVKWEIVNTGGNQLDSMYAAFWSDPDIGDANNDFVGCDPELNLGYSYNDFIGDIRYGSNPPTVGYVYLQTPIKPSLGDTALVSGDPIFDYKNIPMNAFSMFSLGYDTYIDPDGAEILYNYMNGLIGETGEQYIDPVTGQPTTYVFNGDPVTGDGWVDYNYYPSGDRRFLITAGPFSMAPSDTQEVAVAIVIAQGTDNISSITYLRQLVPWIQLAYDTDFDVIGPPLEFGGHIVPTTIEDAVGPYHLEVDIDANIGFELDTFSPKMFFGVNNISSFASMTNDGSSNTYSADVYSNGSSGIFMYYFYAKDANGNGVYYPPGAPTGYFKFEVGPDQSHPVLENFTELSNTIYPNGNEIVSITASDRFSPDVSLNFQINNGSIQNQTMNRIPETERFKTRLTWSNLFLGDQIDYWVMAVDGSNAANTTVSDTHTFVINDSLAIGDWEAWQNHSVYPYNLDQNKWLDSSRWYAPHHGRWVGNNLETFGVDAGWIIIAPVAGVQPDTVISGTTFDITPFKEAGLAFRFACSIENITARVEAASNDIQGTSYDILDSSILHVLDWTLVDSLVSVGGPGVSGDFVEQEVSLSGFDTPVFIRISAEAPVATTPFIIDDIYLKVVHSLGTENDHNMIPSSFILHQNYPNPFNPTTTIRYELPVQSKVRLTIYNVMGQEVVVLVNGELIAGEHEVIWNAGSIPSGIYFYRLETPGKQLTKKLVVLK